MEQTCGVKDKSVRIRQDFWNKEGVLVRYPFNFWRGRSLSGAWNWNGEKSKLGEEYCWSALIGEDEDFLQMKENEKKDQKIWDCRIFLCVLSSWGLPLELILSRPLWHNCIIFSNEISKTIRLCPLLLLCPVLCWLLMMLKCEELNLSGRGEREYVEQGTSSSLRNQLFTLLSDHPFLECSCESRTWDRDQNELSWKRTSLDWLHRRRWALPLEEAKRNKENQERREQTKRTARSYLQLSWRKWRWIFNSGGILLCVWPTCDFTRTDFFSPMFEDSDFFVWNSIPS